MISDVAASATRVLEHHHRAHPLLPGLGAPDLGAASAKGALRDEVLDAVLEELVRDGTLVREGTTLRLPGHRIALGEREADATRLVERIAGAEPTPPTVPELEAEGFGADLVEGCVRTGRLARVSREVVVTPAFLARAEEVVRREAASAEGLTVSGFRQALGTTRKYALPLLGSFDERRITRRDGDVRRLRAD